MSRLSIIHHAAPTPEQRELIFDRVGGEIIESLDHCWLCHAAAIGPAGLADLRAALPFDINPLPEGFVPGEVRLIVSDMDSTLIAIECIDEIADMLGLKPQVAAITEAAMRGELEFAEALTRRVALLEGLPAEQLQRVYDERLRLNPGAETLMETARRLGIKTAVVSGGFTFFTERVRQRLGLDYALANELEVTEGRLTGRVLGTICGAEAKAEFLERTCRELDIDLAQSIAVGDGANDLPMLNLAGLGVAYHAKPKVQAEADVVINHGGLDSLCHFLSPLPGAAFPKHDEELECGTG
ncbi:phosphoserine phosphatase SerB [Methyloterricola oryzae]|uniref:phosphoserine phosphatase SerB n=1 Tax=Methyloterricola oryzae TaxID=1495050 RepID=UPI0005EBD5A8|nr:phosphoserine phosphatase SerB [Methyloterricola oryzae]